MVISSISFPVSVPVSLWIIEAEIGVVGINGAINNDAIHVKSYYFPHRSPCVCVCVCVCVYVCVYVNILISGGEMSLWFIIIWQVRLVPIDRPPTPSIINGLNFMPVYLFCFVRLPRDGAVGDGANQLWSSWHSASISRSYLFCLFAFEKSEYWMQITGN